MVLEIVILHLDASSISNCRLVSAYLRNFIDGRKSLIYHQRNLICQKLFQAFDKVKLITITKEILGPLTKYSQWKAILDHICGLEELGSLKAFLIHLKKFNVFVQKENDRLINLTTFFSGFTPLEFAMHDENMVVLEILLNSGMIELVTESPIMTKTIFCDACKWGTLKVVKLVLSHLEDVDVDIGPVMMLSGTDSRLTFLHVAAMNGNLKVMPFLLDLAEKKGIDVNARFNNHSTMWHLACRGQSLDMVKYLHTNAEKYGIDLQAITPHDRDNGLHLACRADRIDNLAYLLSISKSIGIDVNAISNFHGSILHMACWSKSTEMVKLILEKSEEHNLDLRKSFSTYNPTRLSVFEQIFGVWHYYTNSIIYEDSGESFAIDVELLKVVLTYAKKNNIELNETERASSAVPSTFQLPPPFGLVAWNWRSLINVVCSEGDLEHVVLVLEYMEDCGISYNVSDENTDGMTALDMVRNSPRLRYLQAMHRHSNEAHGTNCTCIEDKKVNDELTELLLIILPDEKEKQSIASRGETLLQYARKYGTPKHVSYLLKSLEKCGIDI